MASVRNPHGQNTIELTIVLGVVAIAMLALTRYLQSAEGGRVKAAGDRLSQSLFDPESTTTSLNSVHHSYDASYANGFSASHARQASTANRKQSF